MIVELSCVCASRMRVQQHQWLMRLAGLLRSSGGSCSLAAVVCRCGVRQLITAAARMQCRRVNKVTHQSSRLGRLVSQWTSERAERSARQKTEGDATVSDLTNPSQNKPHPDR